MKFRSFGSLVLIGFLGGLPACKKKGEGTPAASDSATVVNVLQPQKKTIRWTLEQPGSIQPYEVTTLEAKFPGHIGAMHVDIGYPVFGPRNWFGIDIPGTLLAELSIPELEQEFKQKEAQKEIARHEVQLARHNLNVAEASERVAVQNVKQMEAGEKRAEGDFQRWKGERDRINKLVEDKIIDKETAAETQNQFVSAQSSRDEMIARRKSSEAMVGESKAKLNKASVEIDAAISRQAGAEADYQRVWAIREYMRIRAPYDGVVTGRHAHTGAFVQPTVGKGDAIVTIAKLDPVRIVAEVPEAAAGAIGVKSPVTVRVQSLRGADFPGVIARTSWALNPDVRSLRVEIDLPNANGRIRPGMYAFVSVPIEIPDAVVVPISAIFYQDEVAYCFFAENGKAVRCPVQIGLRDAENVEVLRYRKGKGPWTAFTGLESVIATHQGPVVDGQKIEIK